MILIINSITKIRKVLLLYNLKMKKTTYVPKVNIIKNKINVNNKKIKWEREDSNPHLSVRSATVYPLAYAPIKCAE